MASLKIYYGPYLSHGIIKHRMQKLYGLVHHLSGLNYCIELIPTSYINKMTIEMKDMEIFRCDIRNLQFNVTCDYDVVCKRAIKAVIEATKLLYTDENVKQYPSINEGMRLYRIDMDNMNDIDKAGGFMDNDVKIIYRIDKKELRPTVKEFVDPCQSDISNKH